MELAWSHDRRMFLAPDTQWGESKSRRGNRARGSVLRKDTKPSDQTLFGAGGGSRTHFSHPFLDAYYGLLRDVSAARRLSRSAFGGRANPGLVPPAIWTGLVGTV